MLSYFIISYLFGILEHVRQPHGHVRGGPHVVPLGHGEAPALGSNRKVLLRHAKQKDLRFAWATPTHEYLHTHTRTHRRGRDYRKTPAQQKLVN